MNTKKFAELELKIAGWYDKDSDYGGEIPNDVIELIEVFGKQGHSGGSAPIVVSLFSKLALFKPIAPITGREEEWVHNHFKEGCSQNKRCGALFMDEKRKPYYLNAIIWRGDTVSVSGNTGWDTFSGTVEGIRSRQYIKGYPFTPKTFYIDCTRVPYDEKVHKISDAVSCSDGDYVYLIKDKSQLEKVWEYYDKYDEEDKYGTS